jgi:hypothetical protein
MPIEVRKDDVQAAENKLFGPTEERAIIALALDQPEFFSAVMPWMKVDYFEQADTRWVFAIIKHHFEKDGVMITRDMCLDVARIELTADDPHQEILSAIRKESDPRDVPIITNRLTDWAKKKAYSQIFSEQAYAAHERGDYTEIEKIIEEAQKITNIGANCHFFFNEVDQLFLEEREKKLTTGFPGLDRAINEGGPIKKDVFCWMGPTCVGKSIALINSGAGCVKRALNTLHITLDMPYFKTALRYCGCFTEIKIRERVKYKDMVMSRLSSIRSTYGAELIIVEYPQDEISTDVIHALLDTIRKIHGIKIDVVVVDYLECMLSRVPAYNKDEYLRQKRVATELCRLAFKEDVLVFTASQTNRSGIDMQNMKGTSTEKVIDLNRVAESYGKTMPLSYIVTINQTKDEYLGGKPESKDVTQKEQGEQKKNDITDAQVRFYIAKNRNGPKYQQITIRINYDTMSMKEKTLLQSLSAKKDEEVKDEEVEDPTLLTA